jgi:predicted nuclease of restriction endonuclease-like (RecB) superfamily
MKTKIAVIDNKSYIRVVGEIKKHIKSAQYRAVLAANQELIRLYWNIGTVINVHAIWGNKFLENLAADIKTEFPDLTGYSVRNLTYMVKFSRLFPAEPIMQRSVAQLESEKVQVPLAQLECQKVQATLAQITWYHHIALMDKVKDLEEYQWYAEQTAENGWTRDVLVHQIETQLYERQKKAKKTTNFHTRLPSPQSELALQTLKDPYIFDFITFRKGMVERDIENELVNNITKMLLELGEGFAFLGKQYHLEVGSEDFPRYAFLQSETALLCRY